SALPLVVPLQLTVALPSTTGEQGNASNPLVVEKTAVGIVPAATPAGTVATSVQLMLDVTRPLPLTPPVTVTPSPTALAAGWPAVPVGPRALTRAIACACGMLVGMGVRVGLAVPVGDGVAVAVGVRVGVAVAVGVGVAAACTRTVAIIPR